MTNIDTRRVDLQLKGTERALDDAMDRIDSLQKTLLESRREAENLRMKLARVRMIVENL